MAKVVLTTITSGYATVDALNANFAAIAAAIENTFSRDGTAPNTFTADLDMNGKRILNLPDPTASTEPVTLGYFEDVIAAIDESAFYIPQNAQNGDYTLVLGDNGKHIYSKNTGATSIGIPNNNAVAFPLGATVTVFNNGTTSMSITPLSGVSLLRAGTTDTGTRTLATKGLCTIMKVEENIWVFSGVGST